MDIMNVLRTGMNMSISRIHIWLCNSCTHKVSVLKLSVLLQQNVYKRTEVSRRKKKKKKLPPQIKKKEAKNQKRANSSV